MKEGVIISVLNFFLPIFPLWFSTLNNLLIIVSLIGIVKDFCLTLFHDRGRSSLLMGGSGGPNSEIFLSDLRELFQRVQFFVVSKIS